MEAKHYLRLNEEIVQCTLCPLHCLIVPGKCGTCRARCNEDGRLIAKTYGMVTGVTTERLGAIPIRFHPDYDANSRVFSIGSYGCNLKCRYCRNAHISQSRAHIEEMLPDNLVVRLKNLRAYGVIGACYTFNEPGVAIEYVTDCAYAVKQAGFANVLDTNAFLTPDIFKTFIEPMDILSIDLKGFDDDFYMDWCEGYLDVVWENIAIASQAKKHMEISIVVVPDANDDMKAFYKAMRDLSIIAPRAAIHLVKMKPLYLLKEAQSPTLASLLAMKKTAELFFNQVAILEDKEDEALGEGKAYE